ncbi:unnamed protein product, partial [Mycena citricolor]
PPIPHWSGNGHAHQAQPPPPIPVQWSRPPEPTVHAQPKHRRSGWHHQPRHNARVSGAAAHRYPDHPRPQTLPPSQVPSDVSAEPGTRAVGRFQHVMYPVGSVPIQIARGGETFARVAQPRKREKGMRRVLDPMQATRDVVAEHHPVSASTPMSGVEPPRRDKGKQRAVVPAPDSDYASRDVAEDLGQTSRSAAQSSVEQRRWDKEKQRAVDPMPNSAWEGYNAAGMPPPMAGRSRERERRSSREQSVPLVQDGAQIPPIQRSLGTYPRGILRPSGSSHPAAQTRARPPEPIHPNDAWGGPADRVDYATNKTRHPEGYERFQPPNYVALAWPLDKFIEHPDNPEDWKPQLQWDIGHDPGDPANVCTNRDHTAEWFPMQEDYRSMPVSPLLVVTEMTIDCPRVGRIYVRTGELLRVIDVFKAIYDVYHPCTGILEPLMHSDPWINSHNMFFTWWSRCENTEDRAKEVERGLREVDLLEDIRMFVGLEQVGDREWKLLLTKVWAWRRKPPGQYQTTL